MLAVVALAMTSLNQMNIEEKNLYKIKQQQKRMKWLGSKAHMCKLIQINRLFVFASAFALWNRILLRALSLFP